MNRTTNLLAALAVGSTLVACGAADASDTADPTTDTPMATDSIEVIGVDYGFDGIPAGTVPIGTQLTFTNASDEEFHEMVLMRIADDEDRSATELLELPDEEAMSLMEFKGVAVAAPGEDGTVVDGDLTLTESGRYVLTCFIPQGADPDVVAAAMEAGGDGPPPDMGDGMPHAFAGMVREVVVE